MATVKRIVCLANSRKLNGRCIAGKELAVGGGLSRWIRPVSAREHEEVSQEERQCTDGSEASVFDIIDVPLLNAQPKSYQQENWLLDPAQRWHKVGRATWDDLQSIVDPEAPLWINGYHTYHGRNDQIPLQQAINIDHSLRLIRADHLTLSVFAPSEAFGDPTRRVQGRFQYGGIEYRLRVTDPGYEHRYLAMQNGEYQVGESILTISLGEPFRDACYKLIAAIIQRTQE